LERIGENVGGNPTHRLALDRQDNLPVFGAEIAWDSVEDCLRPDKEIGEGHRRLGRAMTPTAFKAVCALL
jgi:hypothetical protein